MSPVSYRFMSIDYHLVKRKLKGRHNYYLAILDTKRGKNGRPKYKAMKSLETGNKALARKKAQEILDEGSILSSKDSLSQYLKDFWTPEKSEYIRTKKAEGRNISPFYCHNNLKLIEKYFLPFYDEIGVTKLSELNRQNLLEWRNLLNEKGNLDGGKKRISAATQNKVRQAVWVALEWAVFMGLLPYHPGNGIKRVKETTSEKQIFELEDLEKLFSAEWEDIRAKAACMLAAETGMRLGEVRGLLFDNLHLADGYLDVVTNFIDGEGLKPPKWDKVRLGWPISPRCAMLIREVIRLHKWGEGAGRYVFFNINSEKSPVAKLTIINGLRKAMEKAKIPKGPTFHSFRHTWIAHSSGVLPHHVVQMMVGHTNDITTQKYQHVTKEQREAVSKYQQTIIPFNKEKMA